MTTKIMIKDGVSYISEHVGRGRHMTKENAEKVADCVQMLKDGYPHRYICEVLGVSKGFVCRVKNGMDRD